MIAIFLTKQDAQNYADKIHAWLGANCNGYNAVAWQQPVPNKTADKFYIEIPAEYYKQYYKDSEKIIAVCKTEYDKNSEVKDKPAADWSAVEAKP